MRKPLLLTTVLLLALTMVLPSPQVDAQSTIGRFTRILLNNQCVVRTGTGTPESVVAGNVCDVYLRTDGADGTTAYVKASGAGTTGWTPLASGSSSASAAYSYITKIAEAGLSNEFALGTLATALLVNTTTTGVPTAYAGTSCTNQFVRALSAIGAATCASVALTLDVTGDLPFANLAQIAGLSVLGVAGNATADVAAITAGADFQVLRRSGTTIGFGAIDLAQAAAITGILPTANGGTGQNSTATFPTTGVVATDVNTLTLTNKTYSAEGVGNVLTTVEKRSFQVARCDNVTATSPEWSFPTTNPAVPACETGTNIQKGTLDFADGANALSTQTVMLLPADFTGAVDAKLGWFTSAITGDVVWQVQTICVADAEMGDPAFNTASTVTDTAQGTTLQYNEATITGVTITGCAAGDTMYLRLFRDPAHGADTLAATARLAGFELTYRRAQ